MLRDRDPLIRVHGRWDTWQSAEVPLADLDDVHWAQPFAAPQRLLHAFVQCTSIVSGALPHDCGEPGSHRLKICILRRHTPSSIYAELARRADDRPRTLMSLVCSRLVPLGTLESLGMANVASARRAERHLSLVQSRPGRT